MMRTMVVLIALLPLGGCGSSMTGEYTLRNEDGRFTLIRAAFFDDGERTALDSGPTATFDGQTVVLDEIWRLDVVNYQTMVDGMAPGTQVTFDAALDGDAVQATAVLPEPFEFALPDGPATASFDLSWTPSGTDDAMWATFAGDCSTWKGTLVDLGPDDGEASVALDDLEFGPGTCETLAEVWREDAGEAPEGSVAYGQQARFGDVVVER